VLSFKKLAFLLVFVRTRSEVFGARMMGGGFGGCTINLVKESAIEQLIAEITPAYEKSTGLPLNHYIASIENGTEII